MVERNYGIDLLRLVLMYFICLLHVFVQGGVIAACEPGCCRAVMLALQTISYSALDAFMLISGYVAPDRPQEHWKITARWLQVFFYSFVLTLVLACFGLCEKFEVIPMIKLAFPVTFRVYWYFSAYFLLFFATPLLNRFIFQTTTEQAKRTLVITVCLLSGVYLLNEPFQTQGGYSAIWLIALYLIGALMKRVQLFERAKTWVLLLVLGADYALIWASKVIFDKDRLLNHLSPNVLLSAMLVLVLFARLRPNKKVVAALSPLAFGVYLFHLNPVIWAQLENACTVLAAQPVLLAVGGVLAAALAIFVCGMLAEWVRRLVFRFLRADAAARWLTDRIRSGLCRVCRWI